MYVCVCLGVFKFDASSKLRSGAVCSDREVCFSHVSLHPLRMSAVGVIGVLGGVGEAGGAAVFPQASLRSGRCRGTPWSHAYPMARQPGSHPRSHPVHLVRGGRLQGRQAGGSEAHAVGLVMRRVAVVVVGQLGGGVHEAAVAREVRSHRGGVGRGLLVLASAGEGVELGVADVGESGGGARVVARLGPPRGRQWARRDGGSSAGRGSGAAGAAADGCGAPRCSGRGAIVGVKHGGAGGRASLVVGGGSNVVVAVGGVLT